MNITDLRSEYTKHGLRHADLDENPFGQFRTWFEQACTAELIEPNAMALATVGADGHPTVRNVLLKAYDERGFVFFTNYESDKAKQIAENPHVGLLFSWLALERQVSITGQAEKISRAESLRYFLSRPLGNRMGAWVSHQSRVISSRKILEMKLDEVRRKFADGQVPLPSFWGGYRVVPKRFEFWQGRPYRLHDRFQYLRESENGWRIARLAP